MKTSQLIKELQEIDKTVPFDADVVQGYDDRYERIECVYHNAPHTFIRFESDKTTKLNDQAKVLIQAYLAKLLTQFKTEEMDLDETVSRFEVLIEKFQESDDLSDIVDSIRGRLLD